MRRAIIGEADEALIEGSVPKRGEQKTVVHVEALLVVAVGPSPISAPQFRRHVKPPAPHIVSGARVAANANLHARDEDVLRDGERIRVPMMFRDGMTPPRLQKKVGVASTATTSCRKLSSG
jgi:hypothetical protein